MGKPQTEPSDGVPTAKGGSVRGPQSVGRPPQHETHRPPRTARTPVEPPAHEEEAQAEPVTQPPKEQASNHDKMPSQAPQSQWGAAVRGTLSNNVPNVTCQGSDIKACLFSSIQRDQGPVRPRPRPSNTYIHSSNF